MAAVENAVGRRRPPWRVSLVLVVAAALVLWFVGHEALRFASFNADTYTDYFWMRRIALVPHIAGGVVAILG